MALFQKSVLNQYLKDLDKTKVSNAYELFKAHFHNATIQQQIRDSKEEQYQEGFCRDLFVNVLGYTLNPQPNFNLTTEQKNETDSKKADGAILKDGNVIAVIELKGTNTTDLNTVSPQAFGYKNNQKNCKYVLISNFEKLRFYIDNAIDYEEFNLFTLTEDEFTLLYLCLHCNNLLSDLPNKIKQASTVKEENITKQLYKDYSDLKRKLFTDIVHLNPQYDKLILFKKSQKLLDRILFILFAEDRGLLQANTIQSILDDFDNLKKLDAYLPLYDRFKKHFTYLNEGFKNEKYDVYGYNGGLFAPDEILDSILISDNLLQNYIPALSKYDYETEIDVNILGHIFEHSLNDIEEIQAELDGKEIDKTKTKRKKDGVFYTPKYITKYIVENTVGALCNEKRNEYGVIADNYTPDKRKAKKKELLLTLDIYQNWLLEITIVDPACGSGAFLNQALDFLIQEHKSIDELRAQLLGHSFVLSDHEISILENNIFGVDLNEESVEIARLSLWLRTARKGRKLNSLNNNIKCGNSLIDDATIAGDKAFNWQNEFPTIFERGGFDVVIGNPPYLNVELLSKADKLFYGNNYKFMYKRFDIFGLFIEKALNISNGSIGFIIPSIVLNNLSYKLIRDEILNKKLLTQICYTGSKVFSDATVDSTIIVLSKKENKNITLIDAQDFNNHNINLVDSNYFKDYDNNISISIQENDFISSKVFNSKNEKAEMFFDIFQGIVTGNNESYLLEQDAIKDNNLENDLLIPLLHGRDIEKWHIKNSTRKILYVDSDTNIDNFPFVKKWLENYKTILEKRRECVNGSIKWYSLQWSRDKNQLNKTPKILVQRTRNERLKPRIVATIDEIGYYGMEGINFIIPKEDLNDCYWFITIINSKIIDYLFQTKFLNLAIKADFLKKIPIPKINDVTKNQLSNNSKLMLKSCRDLGIISVNFFKLLHSRYSGININNKIEKWNELTFKDFCKELEKQKIKLSISEQAELMQYFEQEQTKANTIQQTITQTDKEIDTMVYKLYELTNEEIAIVENN